MRVFAALADELAGLGVRHAFTFTAKDVTELVSELGLRGVRVYHTRHEHTAVGMADGYSRASGEVGVAVVGQGVGLTNAMNSLLTAVKAHSRVLVVAGEVPGGATQAAKVQRKHAPQRAMLDALGIPHVDLESAGTAAADLRDCYRAVASGNGPIVVNIPEETLQSEAGDAPTRAPSAQRVAKALKPEDRDTILSLFEEDWTSERTVILAGRGAVRAGALTELLRLGEATRSLLGTTIMAKAYFAGSPYDIGVVGSFSTAIASELLRSADLVLAFGASLNYDTTLNGSIFGGARVVHIDDDPAAHGAFGPVDLAVVADARLAAATLADAIEATARERTGYRTPDIARQISDFRLEDTFADRSAPGKIDPRALMTELDQRLPTDRTVVVDGGHQKRYPVRHLSVPDPSGFVWPTEYGAIGCGLGAALGAAVGRPERLTVLCIGDGALMMSLADLDTASRYGLRLLVVVSDNGGLMAEAHYLMSKGYTGDEERTENPSFESVARSLGYRACTIRELSELDGLSALIEGLNGPALLDCKITDEQLEERWAVFARERAHEQSRLAQAGR